VLAVLLRAAFTVIAAKEAIRQTVNKIVIVFLNLIISPISLFKILLLIYNNNNNNNSYINIFYLFSVLAKKISDLKNKH